MRTLRFTTVTASILATAACTFAQNAGAPPAGCPDHTKCPVNLPAAEIRWEKAFPELGADGPDMAKLHVNPKTGATHLLLRAPKAAVVTWHWHTANEAITVIQGTFTVECEGKRIDLGAGSFTYTPSRLIHRATFTEGCTIAISADCSFDLHWAGAPPAAKKPGEAARPKPAVEQDGLEIEGVPIEAIEIARGGQPGDAPPPGKKVAEPAAVKRILGAFQSARAAPGAAAPSGVRFQWVLTLHAGKGGYVNQVWVLESGEWGFGGQSRGKSAELPSVLGGLAGNG